MEFYLSHKVTGATADEEQRDCTAENSKGEKVELKADYCLMAVGRRPYTDGLELEKAGISTDEKGRIPVNDHLETSVEGIYAIGDVIRGVMLAHKAEDEGAAVAGNYCRAETTHQLPADSWRGIYLA
jgi:dihydrolipoamide dehydrogenase